MSLSGSGYSPAPVGAATLPQLGFLDTCTASLIEVSSVSLCILNGNLAPSVLMEGL